MARIAQVGHLGTVDDALGLELDPAGPSLRALGLWLDPGVAVPAAFVSHAHAARSALGSSRVLTTPETIALARAVGDEIAGAEALGWEGATEMKIDPAFGGGTARLSVVPAGHALGAAQLVVDHPRGRLVYTGDWAAEGDDTYPAGRVVPCDELVLTSTFGLPIFRFEPRATVLAALVDWCAARLADGITPVVLAKTPGPAQSILHALVARGLPVSAHERVRRALVVSAAGGAAPDDVAPYEAGARGKVVVAAADVRATEARPRGRAQVAYASGWALLDAAVEQKRADAAFVLADHADCGGLLGYARGSGAKLVAVTRGHAAPLARMIAASGTAVRALDAPAVDTRGDS